jgi:PhoH-like ATPase
MPLPPAPTQRAALLSADAYDAPVRPTRAHRKPARSTDAEQADGQAASIALFGDAGAGAAQALVQTQSLRETVSGKSKTKTEARSVAAPEPKISASHPHGRHTSAAKPLHKKGTGPVKLFVLDTNVLLHDPMSLFRFEEHDIYLPMIVLEELDGHKKGMTEVARNARQISRSLDQLAAVQDADIREGLKLDGIGHREAAGRLFFQTQAISSQLPDALPQGKADNQILGVVAGLGQIHKDREVVLVSKDINMRVKARALGLPTDDYQNDKTLDDGDLLYSGSLALPSTFWDTQGKTVESWQQGGHTFYRISSSLITQLLINQFVYFEAPGAPSLYARVTEIRGNTAVLKTLRDYGHGKNAVWGVTTRNREQTYAMNLLMDPDVDLVTLAGTAGTGKTLLALAAGLTQVLDERRYTEIIMTRATVSVGEDIGFLPGTEEEKMGPWMGALDDNLEFLTKNDSSSAGEWGRAATHELIRSKIKIKSMNFMRGRTFMNKYVIIDEAQNLTPKQMKTLITRAGPGTKMVCMGNLAQIDTPYLTEGSSGMTFVVDKFKGWPHTGHITLARGERSRLADFASEVL